MQKLSLGTNQIGDAGMIKFSEACAGGSLPQLQELVLHGNQIGDGGMQALASAVVSGSLASLKKVVVDTKHERHPQLMAACQARGVEIV